MKRRDVVSMLNTLLALAPEAIQQLIDTKVRVAFGSRAVREIDTALHAWRVVIGGDGEVATLDPLGVMQAMLEPGDLPVRAVYADRAPGQAPGRLLRFE